MVPVPILSGVNKGFRWLMGAYSHGCWLGTYELAKQNLMAERVKPGMVAYDIGANAGFYCLALSRLVGPSGRVFAFEPNGNKVALLKRHLRLNRIANVTIVQAAVADRTGVECFATNTTGGVLVEKGDFIVPTVALDDLDLPAPDFIKIDVDGAEARLLSGAIKVLSSHPIITLATHSNELYRACREALEGAGYDVGLTKSDIEWENDEPDIIALPPP